MVEKIDNGTDCEAFTTIIFTIGIIWGAKFFLTTLYAIIHGLRAHVWSKLWDKQLVKTYGKWAVVTGCTDGIGKEYAYELAKNGMNLLLISRTMEKLQNISKDIQSKFDVETEVVQADFNDGRKVYDAISSHILNKEIGILVNNVGVITSHPMIFGEITDDNMWGHVNVNVASVPAMTKLVLPVMLARKKGAIINLASVAARCPIPLLGIYAASKAFVEYFSEAFEAEYHDSGITVQTITPSYVSTNMTKFNDKVHIPSFFVPSARTFAAHALSTLGYTKYTTGYWTHGLQAFVVDNFLPRMLLSKMLGYNNKQLVQDMKKKFQ